MVSGKIFVLILVLVSLAGAASIEANSDGDDKDDPAAVEVLPMEKASPAGKPVEMSTTRSDDAPLDASEEPPGNPTWWQKTKAWLKKHSEATKQWVAKTFHKKKAAEPVGTSTPASSEPDVPGAEKMEEPAGNPGWWQKTKNWFSGLFGSKKEGGKEKEQKVEEANKS